MTIFRRFDLDGEPATDSGWRSKTGNNWRMRMTAVSAESHVRAQMNGEHPEPVPRSWTLVFSVALMSDAGGIAALRDGRLLIMEAETLTIGPDALANAEFDLVREIDAFRIALLDKAECWLRNMLALQAIL